MRGSLDKFNRLVDALQELPTIGKKSATRLAYHMVMKDSYVGMKISHTIEDALGSLKKCTVCGGMSEDELCFICSDERRDSTVLCIIENAKDILLLEENGLFDGRYFVLDSLEELSISHLVKIVESGVNEVLFALTPSISNDAVILYIEDKLSGHKLSFSKIAQGVPTGVSLENIDILSLTRALEDRVKV
ncbi:recombination protein RecR [Sulfurimonas gotlandica GD1]|uniref:Recombination protein RecR n=1 Tax=Sulfurimonas gotlandica (strain DSM 19862 / JCM 16533 / GD1) TaxID=929558 RepID=B6BMK1_SULGG|nr:recombination mediator RecR [Sulfurimonas gotlandica]EDZ61521.1 recombination protein RecR [Sulfurimonas gotlandica GD1]EHP30884.1 recombination protein RecR [Sulfurimonas gotlandica GD1]